MARSSASLVAPPFCRRQQKPQDAHREFTLATKLDPDAGLAAIHRGAVLIDRGDLEAATLTLARAVQLDSPEAICAIAPACCSKSSTSAPASCAPRATKAVEEVRQRRHRLKQKHRQLPILAPPAPRVGALRDQWLSTLRSSN